MTPEQAQAEMLRLATEANALTEFMLKRLERFGSKPGRRAKSIDARVVSMACARIAGIYMASIKDPVVRQHYRDTFPTLFQRIIDTPTNQENQR